MTDKCNTKGKHLNHNNYFLFTQEHTILEWSYVYTVGKKKGAPCASNSAQPMLSIAGV